MHISLDVAHECFHDSSEVLSIGNVFCQHAQSVTVAGVIAVEITRHATEKQKHAERHDGTRQRLSHSMKHERVENICKEHVAFSRWGGDVTTLPMQR